MTLYYSAFDPESMGYGMEDFTDYCNLNDFAEEERTDDFFYQWQESGCVFEWDILMDEVTAFDKANDGYYYVEGTLGLWDGKRSVFALFPTLKEAIRECVAGSDSCAVESQDDGSIEVCTIHHDGCNRFAIKRITYDSYLRWDGNQYEGEYEPTEDEILPIK